MKPVRVIEYIKIVCGIGVTGEPLTRVVIMARY